MFESRQIDEQSYPIMALAELLRERSSKLMGKYRDIKGKFEIFQSLVLREIEAVNYTVTYKRASDHESSSKSLFGDLNNSRHEDENLNKFTMLFKLLKDRILKEVEIRNIEDQERPK